METEKNPAVTDSEELNSPEGHTHNLWLYCALPLLIAAIAVVYVLATRWQSSGYASKQASTPLPTGDAAYNTYPIEEFTLDFKGGSLSLYDCADTPLVLRFFSPLEENLPEELALFERLSAEYKGSVLFIPVCIPEETEKANAVFTENGVTLPVYTDTLGKAKEACAVTQVPSTVFIDKDGFLAAGSNGAIDEETLRFGISLIAPKD